MAKNIEPRLRKIKDYLKINSNEQFVIPAYQRGYSWQQEQCEKLIDDVNSYINDGNSDDPYFLGTIIIDCSNKDQELDLIDGQQRTTTFLLLLKALQLRLNATLEKIQDDPDQKILKKSLEAYRNEIISILFKADDIQEACEIVEDWNKTKNIILVKNYSIQEYNGQGFLDKKILKKSVFYRSMSCHAVSPVFPNSECSL